MIDWENVKLNFNNNIDDVKQARCPRCKKLRPTLEVAVGYVECYGCETRDEERFSGGIRNERV